MFANRFRHLCAAAAPRPLASCAFVVSLAVATTASAASLDVWSPASESDIDPTGVRLIAPNSYLALEADLAALETALRRAPVEAEGAWDDAIEISLPMADGSPARFRVIESPIMAPALAEKFPEMRTYLGQGLDDRTATVRFELVPDGLHAMIIGATGTVLVDPYQRGDRRHHIVYRKQDLRRAAGSWTCVLDATEEEIRAAEESIDGVERIENGTELRTYRLAVAATGEYTTFHGGTVGDGMSAIMVAVARVTGIYERELAVRMELVANNDLIVYTNGATDPYTNNNGVTMLGQNQANLDAVIGSANYDIGHVFSTGGGGVASLGVVCVDGFKARGVTGLGSPIGDTFYVDYVAHEMGHQFNSTHTFNGTAGACGGGNRTASTAYEPGSGSTIMAYAGICSPQNIQFFSDDYFSSRSQDIIIVYTNNQSACAVVTNNGNTPPVPDATQPVSFTDIPISTPFTLTGSATDDDGDEITYCWEEFDLGPAGHPNSPSGNAPIFRSFLPVLGDSRTFPAWSDILNNTQTMGEILPTYTRNLRFRLIVRDNRAGGGGTDHRQIQFGVDDTAGPFLVTAPNGGESWSATVDHDVTWDVANTDNADVNCQTVDILLSTDGGLTYPMTLAAGTANDGVETVTLPIMDTSTARVMVAAADNIFFDISDFDFTITSTVAVGDPTADSISRPHLIGNRPNPANPATRISFTVTEDGEATLRIFDSAGRAVAELTNGFVTAGTHVVSWDGRDFDGRAVAAGVYFYRLEVGDVRTQRKMVVAR